MYAKFALPYVCVCVFMYANGLAICCSYLWQDDPHRPTTVDPFLNIFVIALLLLSLYFISHALLTCRFQPKAVYLHTGFGMSVCSYADVSACLFGWS